MADKKDDLPGFYRDPKTGKYFREKPESSFNPSLKKFKKTIEEKPSQNVTSVCPPKILNSMQYLRSRELGFVSCLNAESEYLKLGTRNKWIEEELHLNSEQPFKLSSVDFIKGTKNSILGVWNVDKAPMFRCVVGEKAYNSTEYSPRISFMGFKNFAMDMCDGPEDSVVCLFNHPYSKVGCFAFLPHTSTIVDLCTSRWSSPLFCCASAKTGTFAFGCSEFIRYYNKFHCEKTYFVKGRIHSLAFNESSNTMISGAHSGKLYLHDVRQKMQVMELQVSPYCVTDVCFLNTNQVIAAGVNNMLKKIDLRAQNPVSEFFGHKSSVKKRPLSIANSMLCVPGSDNIIRIWHESGGHPVHEMAPVNSPENESRGWLHSDGNKTYLYQYELDIQRKYRIT